MKISILVAGILAISFAYGYIGHTGGAIDSGSPVFKKVFVNGDIRANGSICGSKGCAGDGSEWQTGMVSTGVGQRLYYNKGPVGIGTIDPQAKLQVAHEGDSGISLKGTWSDILMHANGGYSRIFMNDLSSAYGNQIIFEDNNREIGAIETNNGFLYLRGVLPNRHFSLDLSKGNIGIGTTNPKSKLDVNGKITSQGTTDADSANTVATKGYVDSKIGDVNGKTPPQSPDEAPIQIPNDADSPNTGPNKGNVDSQSGGVNVQYVREDVYVPYKTYVVVHATCPSGTKVINCGFYNGFFEPESTAYQFYIYGLRTDNWIGSFKVDSMTCEGQFDVSEPGYYNMMWGIEATCI